MCTLTNKIMRLFRKKEIYIGILSFVLLNIFTSIVCLLKFNKLYYLKLFDIFNPIIFFAPFLKLFFLLAWNDEVMSIFYNKFTILLNIFFLLLFNSAFLYFFYKYIKYQKIRYYLIYIFLLIIWDTIGYFLYLFLNILASV